MKRKVGLVLLVFLSMVAVLNAIYSGKLAIIKEKPSFHSEEEKEVLKNLMSIAQTPIDTGEYFLHSSNCRTCHGSDSAHYANIDANGMDINLFDDWQSTMMANSARDPLWRAKVSHEILVNPSHAGPLQDKCTSCHAPMGRYTAHFKGQGDYTLAHLLNDSLGLDGISCTGCHTIGNAGLGTMFSGQIPYDTNRVEYGPYQNPILGPMQLYVGLTPTYSQHVSESKMCSSCHTLITNSADLSGTATGRTFVEQATYHEWLNSSSAADNVTCQNCHMPRIYDSVRIANGYLNLPKRSPFNLHKFQGGNAFMIELIKNNKSKLGITTEDRKFDSSIAITRRNIRYNTMMVELIQDSVTADTAFYRVSLTNLTGHKFPSGYPSRRAVLQFVVTGTNNDTLFQTGIFDALGEVKGYTASYEPHYNTITSQNQHQIYEMVMGDVNGNKTTVLERADTNLKDNRIPPEGFVSLSPVYDTVKIVGDATSDTDFNLYPGGVEGSGRDVVHFHIPTAGFPSVYHVYTRFLYQTVPPSWVNEMFSFSSAEIDSFKVMFQQAQNIPLLVGADSILNIGLGIKKNFGEIEVKIGPDPSFDGHITLFFEKQVEIMAVKLIDMNGKILRNFRVNESTKAFPLQLPEEKGTYIIDIITDQGRITKKAIRQ